jgi:hypothetical protein
MFRHLSSRHPDFTPLAANGEPGFVQSPRETYQPPDIPAIAHLVVHGHPIRGRSPSSVICRCPLSCAVVFTIVPHHPPFFHHHPSHSFSTPCLPPSTLSLVVILCHARCAPSSVFTPTFVHRTISCTLVDCVVSVCPTPHQRLWAPSHSQALCIPIRRLARPLGLGVADASDCAMRVRGSRLRQRHLTAADLGKTTVARLIRCLAQCEHGQALTPTCRGETPVIDRRVEQSKPRGRWHNL